MVISVAFGIKHVVGLIEALFEFSALHSCFNTLIMIMTIGPYKRTILSLFSKIKCYLKPPNQVNINQINVHINNGS
uniref:Ovule protein n=1 Tax=Acrobeloides nanus TaxID=290746 RepID=A0A914EPT9_9BILA